MQGEKVPKAQLGATTWVIKFSQQETPHIESPPKVRADADAKVINRFSFCTSAPRVPVCGRRIGLRPLELSSPTGRMPGIIPPAAVPWEHISASEESWDECRGTWTKVSRKALLLSPRWHCTKSKQVMKPDHSACFSLPDMRIQMRFPTSPPSSVWPVILQPARELPLLFSIHKTSFSPCPQQPRAVNTHQTPPQEWLHLSRDVETHSE